MDRACKLYQHQKKFLCRPRIFPVAPPANTSLLDLVEMYSKSGAYNAGRIAEACKLLERMINENATIALTLAGAMTPTGMGGSIIKMMENGFIDFIVSTGANLYHDLHFALDLPIHQGDFRVNDVELLEAGIERIYDIFITDQLLEDTDKFLQDIFDPITADTTVSTSALHRMIGEVVLKKSKKPELSLLAMAAKYDVPVYTSSPGDSSIGMNLAASSLKGSGLKVDPSLDVIETTAIVYNSPKNGVIEIGGGSPKNFYLQTQPTLHQIMGINKGGHDFFIQVTTDSPQWGGLSGATPQEAISWGKVNPHDVKNNVVVYCDATVAAPILFGYALNKMKPRPRKCLYNRLEEYRDSLKAGYLKK